MRLLIYNPWEAGSQAASDLSALITRHGWSAHWFAPSTRLCAARHDASDYHEWVLLHERETHSRRFRKMAQRDFDAFIGFGSASAVFADALPRSARKIAFVEQLESERFPRRDLAKRQAASRLLFHRRVEVDLLRSFDRVMAPPELASRLADDGLKNTVVTDIHGIEEALTTHRAA